MTSSALKKSFKLKEQSAFTKPVFTCSKCGGNGYTKSSPDCYKTCLDCLGMGFVAEKNWGGLKIFFRYVYLLYKLINNSH